MGPFYRVSGPRAGFLKLRFKFAGTDPSSTLGRIDEMIIQIKRYDLMVDCETELEEAPSEKDCEAVLADMPAYPKPLAFGTTGNWRTVPGRLPRAFSIGAYLKLA